MNAIELDAVEQVYANGTRALQPMSLSIKAGEFVSLLGPSGCGKSTLLNMMAGLITPTQGRVHVAQQASESRLSFVFQSPTLMPWARVDANVRLPLDLAGIPQKQAAQRVHEALDLVGLGSFAAHRPNELSGGMQMRVSIARALVTQPRILLMDEPFGALDEITRQQLDEDLHALWQRQGLTVVFVTHSVSEAAFLSSRVVMLASRPGRITDDVAIPSHAPRDDSYRSSPDYLHMIQRLSQSLRHAHHHSTSVSAS
jgi:NitT/TauT family transport system ATP-binding protein